MIRPATAFGLLLGLALTSSLAAQELVPRTYWPAPVDFNAAGAGLVFSRGDFVEDSYIPFEVASGNIRALQATYYRSFSLAGRSSSITAILPWADASFKGEHLGVPVQRNVSGLGDVSFRLAMNLLGGAAMTVEEMQRFRIDPPTLIGVSLRIKAPTGQHDEDKLINVGGNRWALKPEVGLVHPITPKILVELYAGLWVFTDDTNPDGQTLEQDPLGSGEIHFIYRMRPGFWASLDINLFSGGRTAVNGVPQPNSFQNSRIGGTLSIPFKKRNIFRFGFSTPLITDFGGDYETLVIGFQRGWM